VDVCVCVCGCVCARVYEREREKECKGDMIWSVCLRYGLFV